MTPSSVFRISMIEETLGPPAWPLTYPEPRLPLLSDRAKCFAMILRCVC
jgi:hypothetical protein